VFSGTTPPKIPILKSEKVSVSWLKYSSKWVWTQFFAVGVLTALGIDKNPFQWHLVQKRL
jgi:hypothetical protein